MRRVVVTGAGMIAPTGNSLRDAWESAVEGRSGVGPISQFDCSDFPVRIAAEVKDFDPRTAMSDKEARQSSRVVQLAAVAVQQAIKESGLDVAGEGNRLGCSVGVGMGGLAKIEKQTIRLRDRGPRKVWPLLIPYAIPNMAAGFSSVMAGLRGPSICAATACASGTHTIGEAFLHVVLGMAEAVVCGGAEAVITPLSMAGFSRMNALSTRNESPTEASRPFDLDRDGFVMGEGCGVLVLEEFEHARQRRAEIYAELVGYGLSADAHHITSPPPGGEGPARCMAAALKMANIASEEIDYLNAHGTSTEQNDSMESVAIETVFGDGARKLSVSSTKGVTGHCIAAAGGIEAAYTVLAIRHGVAPPTINYTTPDPRCRLDYTANVARERTIRYALSNSFGFGGQNASLVFKRFDGSLSVA